MVSRERTIPLASEDGRAVTSCNISPFINNLPNGKNTSCFTTTDASGSTSMAAGCVEALELFGNKGGTLLLDEDGCAGEFCLWPLRSCANDIQLMVTYPIDGI